MIGACIPYQSGVGQGKALKNEAALFKLINGGPTEKAWVG